MTRLVARMLREDDGQDLIEYVLIAGLISVVSILAIAAVGSAIDVRYQTTTATFARS